MKFKLNKLVNQRVVIGDQFSLVTGTLEKEGGDYLVQTSSATSFFKEADIKAIENNFIRLRVEPEDLIDQIVVVRKGDRVYRGRLVKTEVHQDFSYALLEGDHVKFKSSDVDYIYENRIKLYGE